MLWAVQSFFVVYVAQHLMLVGITLPLATVHSVSAPWSTLDTCATVMAVAGR